MTAVRLLRLLTLGLVPASGAMAQDLGECAGHLPGSIESEAVSPPFLGWECDEGNGPGGGDCIVSGLLFSAADPSVAQLELTGPGILSFQWTV